MPLSNTPFKLLIEELQRLSSIEVANFCGDAFFQQTRFRFSEGLFPRPHSENQPSRHDSIQILSFESPENNLIEVALLKSQWDIISVADRLTYRFYHKEFTAAFFSKSHGDIPGRQFLADSFILLWLLGQPESEQSLWGLSKTQSESFKIHFKNMGPIVKDEITSDNEKKIVALLVCSPNIFPPNLATEIIPPSVQPPALYQGQLFKVYNPTALKAKSAFNEASSLGAYVEKIGLCELQILFGNGRILSLRENEDILPFLENHRSEIVDRRMLDKIGKVDESDSLLFRSFERNKFNLIDKYFSENKEVRIVAGYNSLESRPYLICKSFEVSPFGGIYKKSNLSIYTKAGSGQAQIQIEIPDTFRETYVSNQVAFKIQNQQLIYHDFHQNISKLLKFLGEKSEGPQIVQEILTKNKNYVQKGHKKIHSFLKNLHLELGKDFTINSIEEFVIDKVPSIELSVSHEHFGVIQHFESETHRFKFSNLDPEWKFILRGLSDGFIFALPQSLIDSSYSVRRTQRQIETKFLKHTGVFFTVLHSILEWSLKQSLLGKTKPLFYEELWQKVVYLLVPRGENGLDEKFDDLISLKIRKLTLEFIENVIDLLDPEHESTVVYENSLYHFKGMMREQAKIVFFLMDQIAQKTKGDVFSKANSKYFPTHWFIQKNLAGENKDLEFYAESEQAINFIESTHHYSLKNNESQYQIPLAAWARLPQAFPEILIRIDGRPLDYLNAEQFKVQFELSQASEGINDKNRRIDWFDLNPKYFLNGKEIEESQAKKLATEGVLEYQGRFYILDIENFPSHKALEIFWKRLQFNQHVSSKASPNKDVEGATQRHHVLELLALRRLGIPFSGPKEWEAICEYFDRLSQPRGQLDLGPELNATLKPYQLSGVQWLWDLFQLRIGGILADDMGLGKTAQALSFIQYGSLEGSIKKVLVIVPVSLTFNWVTEAEKFTPNLKVSVFDPKLPETLEAEVIVCTYSLLSIHHQLFESQNFDVVIFDEAQYLKNIGTNRFKSSEHIKAKFKVALTGTPIENNLSELYALFHLVAPGLLGTRQDFHNQYVKPDEINEKLIEFLKAKLKPLILRRRKQDLSLELPDKTENQIYVEFSKKQKELYRNTALSWSQRINEAINQKGASQSKLYMLTALLRLRQVCSDPAALPSVSYKEVPPKITILLDMLQEITDEGHSAIVFTQFMSTFNRLKDLLKKQNIKAFEMHGGTPRKDREVLLREFSNEVSDKGSVLLMTLKTGGVGLNLTKASYVFHIEPWWNPAVENQATDRVHRLGQKKNVTVYRLIMKESVEEKVELLKKRKAQLFNNLFGDDYFSLESVEDSSGTSEKASSAAITKEDFDILVQ